MMMRPVGWRQESYRHYLASKGIQSKMQGLVQRRQELVQERQKLQSWREGLTAERAELQEVRNEGAKASVGLSMGALGLATAGALTANDLITSRAGGVASATLTPSSHGGGETLNVTSTGAPVQGSFANGVLEAHVVPQEQGVADLVEVGAVGTTSTAALGMAAKNVGDVKYDTLEKEDADEAKEWMAERERLASPARQEQFKQKLKNERLQRLAGTYARKRFVS